MQTEMKQLRPEVLRFALLMEQRLCEKDEDKGSRWKSKTPADLIVDTGLTAHRLMKSVTKNETYKIVRHAIDLANYCMMVADVSGSLESEGSK